MSDSRGRHKGSKNEPEPAPQENRGAEAACDGDQMEASAVPAEELLPDEGEEREDPSEIEVLQGETALLEQQLEQTRDRYIRAVADLDNSRKRARQAIAEARQQAVGNVLLDLLLLLDNFERALETVRVGPGTSEETRAIYDGVALTYRQFKEVLERRGVRPIDAVGQPFDPSRHEAVARVPADGEYEEGTIALEMQKGYMHGDTVLRPSRVGVVVRAADTAD